MTTYVRKYTSGSRPSSPNYLSAYTDSSAKKFVTNDSVENNSVVDSTNNAEHLVNLASGLQTLGLSVASLAQQAKAQIANAVTAVMQVQGTKDPLSRKPMTQYSEEDVNTIQQNIARTANQYYINTSSNTIRKQLSRQMLNQVSDSRHSFIPNKMENMTVRTTNQAIPQIESITVDVNKNSGATDNFSAGILFNIPVSSSQDVKLIRIFRAELKDPVYTRPLAVISSNGMQRLQSYRGSKTQNVAAATALRYDENDVPNAVSLLNYVNPFTGQRVSAIGDQSLLVPPPLPNQKSNPNLDIDNLPPALSHIDRSVAGNINVIYNLQNNPILGINTSFATGSTTVGGDRSTGTYTPVVIDQSNKLEFKEVANFTPGGITTRQVGEMVEYYYEDTTITYGGGYKYFIVTVNSSAVQSARSTVVDIVVEGLRIPPRPLNVVSLISDKSITLTMTSTDQLVEKFEIYRLDNNPSAAQQAIAQTISDQQGFSVSAALHDIGKNNYLLVGECFNSVKSGGSFMDGSTIPGRPYTYRVYAVDIFGNKSESPFQIDAFIPDPNQQYVALKNPSLVAEVDAATHKMKLTFTCDDMLVQRLTLQRRDLTIGEEAFTVPSSPSRTIYGYGRSPIKNRPSMSGEMMFNNNLVDVWTGVFNNTGQQQVFIDKTVQYDHIYQYRVYGEDRYGNKTSYVISPPTMTVRRPLVNAPVSLAATAIQKEDGSIKGVQINWMPGTLDVSAGDQIGSQNDLSNTAVRTLYQVQRRQEGDDRWLSFPLMSGTVMIDSIAGASPAPNFRPPYVESNTMYHYRVQAMQTGAFVSNFTEPVSVFVGYNVAAPSNFIIRTPSAFIRPFYVMLNWDTPTQTGVVDHWEIERAMMSNVASAQLNMSNPEGFAQLEYKPFRIVYREASRFSGASTDVLPGMVNGAIIVGTHYYMDTQVDFGNSCFYRMRAVSPEGQTSKWVYRGVKITSVAFEQKYQPLISDEEKKELIATGNPLMMAQTEKIGTSSYSIQPNYSRPRSAVVDRKWYERASIGGDE